MSELFILIKESVHVLCDKMRQVSIGYILKISYLVKAGVVFLGLSLLLFGFNYQFQFVKLKININDMDMMRMFTGILLKNCLIWLNFPRLKRDYWRIL